jgi:hypothetical protein
MGTADHAPRINRHVAAAFATAGAIAGVILEKKRPVSGVEAKP